MRSNTIDTKAPFAPTKHLCLRVPPSIGTHVLALLKEHSSTCSHRISQTNDWVVLELKPEFHTRAKVSSFASNILLAIQESLSKVHSPATAQNLTSQISVEQLDVDDYRKSNVNRAEYIRDSIKAWIDSDHDELARSCYLLMADGQPLSWTSAKENAQLILEQIDDPDWLSSDGRRVGSPDWAPMPSGGVALNKGPEAMVCSDSGRPIYPYVTIDQESDPYIGKTFSFERLGTKTCLMDADGALLATIQTHLGTDDQRLMSRIIQCLNYCKDIDAETLSEQEPVARPQDR